MSRLGDKIHQERVKKGLSVKEIAKKGGVTVSFLLDVESGRKIINDAVASRILKNIGSTASIVEEFEEVGEVKAEPVKRMPARAEKDAPLRQTVQPNEQWKNALSSVIKNVPVYNISMKREGYHLIPVEDGKINGYHADKVFFIRVPDNSLSGFRLLKGDKAFIVPVHQPVNDAIMLVEQKDRRVLRKIKKIEGNKVLLISHDRQVTTETVNEKDISIMGQCIRVEFTL